MAMKRPELLPLLPATERLLREAEKALNEETFSDRVVITGAVAASFRGAVRSTEDLNLIVFGVEPRLVIRAFRRVGFRVNMHLRLHPDLFSCVATPRWAYRKETHVDVMFPTPFCHALFADKMAASVASRMKGTRFLVANSLLLATSKLWAARCRDFDRHKLDFIFMIKRRIVDRIELKRLIGFLDKSMLPTLNSWLREASRKDNPPWGKKGRWRK
jgi:hypothetical protein